MIRHYGDGLFGKAIINSGSLVKRCVFEVQFDAMSYLAYFFRFYLFNQQLQAIRSALLPSIDCPLDI